MNAQTVRSASSERVVRVPNGWPMLLVTFGFLFAGFGLIYYASHGGSLLYGIGGAILCKFLFVVFCFGFFTLQPNEARVLILFGSYKGTVRESGFHWTNPFNRKL